MKLVVRDVPPRTVWALEQAGVHPLLARLYAGRGVQSKDELDDALARLLPPATMKGTAEAAVLLADAIAAGQKLCIVADYDCDGATACALGVRGLRMLGAQHVHYLVPDRVVDGYGLTPPIAQRVKDSGADVLITVDNGIASFEGIATARALGLQTLVTDHHLPAAAPGGGGEPHEVGSLGATERRAGPPQASSAPEGLRAAAPSLPAQGRTARRDADSGSVSYSAVHAVTSVGATQLPAADVIVNPNQPGCPFESKNIAGVGVMFYVLLALRAELRQRGAFTPVRPEPVEAPASTGSARTEAGSARTEAGSARTEAGPVRTEPRAEPRLDTLLPLVALGTVADVVRLDANNRRLVAQGLKRVRAGGLPPGMAALFNAAGRDARVATTFDFGFALGPRINAAGRLSDMTLGIECLLTDDPARADELARTLDGINRERREIEGEMREQALQVAASLFDESEAAVGAAPPAICVFDPDFHEGVVGIVASRIKDRYHRPAFVFAASAAPGREHELKGSGRSIPGFHLRDALDLVTKRHPGVLLRFGGHAMAAGCTIAEEHFDRFEQALAEVAREWLDAATLTRRLDTDGPLAPEYRRTELVDTLHREVWGQGFAPPTFSEEVEVVSQRLVGEKHLALKLRHQGQPVDGIWFGHTEPLPARVKLAFRLDADEWQGVRRVRFLVEGAEI